MSERTNSRRLLSVRELARELGVRFYTARDLVDRGEIRSARDGEPRGVFLARSPEEAAGLTAMIVSKATDELARIKRREDYSAALVLWPPVQQLDLFGSKVA